MLIMMGIITFYAVGTKSEKTVKYSTAQEID
jgi:hypothetical protein